MPEHYDFKIYSEGICYASACTSLTDEAAVDRMTPTGIKPQWQLADEPFASGEPNGIACPDHPETHRHLLFVC